jgi:hypothetical protein
MNYYVTAVINLSFFAFPVIAAFSKFAMLDKALKIFSVGLVTSLIAECAALWAAVKFNNNFPVYAIANITDLVIVCLYFNYSVPAFKKRGIGIYLAILSVIAGVLNLVFLESLFVLNDNFINFQGILIIALCLFSMYQQLFIADNKMMRFTPHFKIAALLLVYWVISFLNWGLYDFSYVHLNPYKWLVNNLEIILCCIFNLCFSLIFLSYHQQKRSYA